MNLNKWIGVSLLAAGMATSANANLVVNGGFETGNFSGWTTQAAAFGSNYGVINGQSHSGTFSARFQANQGQQDAIWQTLNTVQGTNYKINFWLYNAGVGDDNLQVLWEGSNILNQAPIEAPLESWTEYTLNAVATTNGSEFKFRLYDGNAWALLDDVNVTASPVPEPATMAVLGGGLLLLIRRRRAQ